MLITPRGSASAKIWIIAETPLSSDSIKGYMFSGGAGHVFTSMLKDAGIHDYYICARRPDTGNGDYVPDLLSSISLYKPPFVLFLGAAAQFYIKELEKTPRDKTYKTALNKYVGSLLKASSFNWEHYAIALHGVEVYLRDWKERQITTYFDLQKIREELKFYLIHNNNLQPLPHRQLIFKDLEMNELLGYFNRFSRATLLSIDIETCYPKADSDFFPHPGYALTIGIADCRHFGISFNLFREDKNETKTLWKALFDLLRYVPNLGQNYFGFDAHYLSALGFQIKLEQVQDTLLRHHILFPELPHKLQFQTRQYTREVYYKDEGHHWGLRNMSKLRRYNCLDVCVTYEIWEEQELEFKERPHLI